MDISIPGLTSNIVGATPVVILGANGSGKTRLAVQMTSSGNAEFIGAVRNIALPDQIPNWSLQTATNELIGRTTQRKKHLLGTYSRYRCVVWEAMELTRCESDANI